MSALSPILRDVEGNGLNFWCPGCNGAHGIKHGPDGWSWNGDVLKPTFRPSVLVRTGHHASHWKAGDSCWCTYNAEEIAKGQPPAPFDCAVCHSFVRDGMIQFLGDCTHKLAGQTVPLPAWPQRTESENG
jgi:hypothetical protein